MYEVSWLIACSSEGVAASQSARVAEGGCGSFSPQTVCQLSRSRADLPDEAEGEKTLVLPGELCSV